MFRLYLNIGFAKAVSLIIAIKNEWWWLQNNQPMELYSPAFTF